MVKNGCILLSDPDLDNVILLSFVRLSRMFQLLDIWCAWAYFRGIEEPYRPACWADWWPLDSLYPDNWPRCPVCGDYALDGKRTCGRVTC